MKTATKFTPSKKRYDKQALASHNSNKEFGHMYYLNSAADTRETMKERLSWILEGQGIWFGSYFKWRRRYKNYLRIAKDQRLKFGETLPLPD